MNARAAVAFHEAGHAVMGWYAGFPPIVVTIVPGEWTDGHATLDEPPEQQDLPIRCLEVDLRQLLDRTLAHRRAMVAAAGVAAEEIKFGGHMPIAVIEERRTALRFFGSNDFAALVELTRSFLEQPAVWRRVDALASVLLDKTPTIEGTELLDLIRAA